MKTDTINKIIELFGNILAGTKLITNSSIFHILAVITFYSTDIAQRDRYLISLSQIDFVKNERCH